MSRFTPRLPPDPDGLNSRRAQAAEVGLLAFARDFGETDDRDELGALNEQAISDLLANLAHYCDRKGLSFQSCLEVARENYAAETDFFGTQYDVSSDQPGKDAVSQVPSKVQLKALNVLLSIFVEDLQNQIKTLRQRGQ